MLKYKIQNIKYEIKYAWQRAFRGYDDRAVWNINTWFLDIMPKLLTHMKENHCGYPQGLSDNKWEKILGTMSTCFTEADEDKCSKVNKYQKEYDQMWEDFTNEFGYFGDKLPQPEKCINEGNVMLYMPSSKEVNRKDWQKITNKFLAEDAKIGEYRNKKLQEGLELFTEYFWNLWD